MNIEQQTKKIIAMACLVSHNKAEPKELEMCIEKALKENTEATCKAMLVEERGEPLNFNDLQKSKLDGFNQCCALQKSKADKLKKLC